MSQSVLARFDKVSRIIGKFEMGFACILLVSMVTIVGTGVFLRYVLKSPLVGGVNFATLMLVWLTFFGASFVYRERGHIAIEFIVDRLPALSRHIVMVFIYIIIGFMLIVTLIQSSYLIEVQWKQEIVALDIPRSFLSIPIFIAALLMIFTTVRHIILEIDTFNKNKG